MPGKLGIRLMVGQRSLEPYVEVRILDPQPLHPEGCPSGCFYIGCGAKLLGSPLDATARRFAYSGSIKSWGGVRGHGIIAWR